MEFYYFFIYILTKYAEHPTSHEETGHVSALIQLISLL